MVQEKISCKHMSFSGLLRNRINIYNKKVLWQQ